MGRRGALTVEPCDSMIGNLIRDDLLARNHVAAWAADAEADGERHALPPGAGVGGFVACVGAAPLSPPLGLTLDLGIPRAALGTKLVAPCDVLEPPGFGRLPLLPPSLLLVRADDAAPAPLLDVPPLPLRDEAPIPRPAARHGCCDAVSEGPERGRVEAQPESEFHPVVRKLMQRSRSGFKGWRVRRRSTKA